MATLVTQDGRYALQFYDSRRTPKRKRVALKTGDRRTALKLKRQLESDHLLGDYDPWTDDPFDYRREPGPALPLTLQEACDRFVEEKRLTNRSSTTVRTYGHILGLFARTTGATRPLAEVAMADAVRFIRDESVAPATRYTRYRHLKAFFSWAMKEALLASSPLAGAEAPSNTHRLPKVMDEKDLEAICTALRSDYDDKLERGACREGEMVWMIPLFRFAFYTGLRASELGRLRWRDIDETRGLLYILKQKNGKQQALPLSRRALDVLVEVPHGEPDHYVFVPPQQAGRERAVRSFVWHVSLTFREARRLAKIDRPISFHSLRHGYCTALARAGKSVAVIQKAARHATPQMSMRYVDLAVEDLRHELDDAFGR